MAETKRAMALGTLIHRRYRIERVLGEGGFGVTYLAHDLQQNQAVAVKEYLPVDFAVRRSGSIEVIPQPGHQKTYERFRDKFLEEARIIYRYQGHPNIIKVLHLFYENNTAYYVMEFIQGSDLNRLLISRGDRISWEELKPIMAQVTEAMAAIHKGGIIHCDISPDNIFILNGGQVKLIDFGAAKSVVNGPSSIVLLKRGYAPPEQMSSNGRMGPWTDIYAMAATIYRCCTGQIPPCASDRLTSDRTIWPSQLGVRASGQWEAALRKAMSLRIEQRYQDVRQFWADLNETLMPVRPVLHGIQGIFAGVRIDPAKGPLIFGTDRTRCSVTFPMGTPGISQVHLRLWYDDATLMAMDMRSSYGTWIGKQKMAPGLGYPLPPGAQIYMGDHQLFQVILPESR